MDAPPQTWFNWIVGGLVALLTMFVRADKAKLDKIASEYVSRDDLARFLTETREERREMHRENISRLDRLADDVEKCRSRIDIFYRPGS